MTRDYVGVVTKLCGMFQSVAKKQQCVSVPALDGDQLFPKIRVFKALTCAISNIGSAQMPVVHALSFDAEVICTL